jgi:3-oxoacyl-[acyl-carrier-protein] synthase II
MDRLCGLALVACDAALVDGGLAPAAAEWDGARTALVLGSAYGCHATNEDYYRGVVAGGPGGASPRLFAYTLPSSPVGEISIHYGVRGPATTLTPGLTAGVEVLGEGLRLLASGRADRALVIAAEVATPLLGRLVGQAAPLRDAAAAVLLERATLAATRGATIYGRVLACAVAHASGQRARAVADAAALALAECALPAAALSQVLGDAPDVAAVRALGIVAPGRSCAEGALGAAPLVAAVGWLRSRGLALLVAGDPAGAGAAAILESSYN